MMIGEKSWRLGSWIKSPIIDLCLGWSREEVQSMWVKDFDSPREERNGITGRQLIFLYKIKSLEYSL